MARINTVKGLATILVNLEKSSKATAKGVQRGLKKAGLLVQRESQKIVPIDTSNLKASAFTRAKGKGFDTIVSVGYTAAYAIFVHENLDAKHKEGKTAKFLEKPIRTLKDDILEWVKKEAKI